jgi:hypothetical protein
VLREVAPHGGLAQGEALRDEARPAQRDGLRVPQDDVRPAPPDAVPVPAAPQDAVAAVLRAAVLARAQVRWRPVGFPVLPPQDSDAARRLRGVARWVAVADGSPHQPDVAASLRPAPGRPDHVPLRHLLL